MLVNLYATTEPRPQLPAYLSVNVDELGVYTVSVRPRGDETASVIQLEPAQLRDMAHELLARLPA